MCDRASNLGEHTKKSGVTERQECEGTIKGRKNLGQPWF